MPKFAIITVLCLGLAACFATAILSRPSLWRFNPFCRPAPLNEKGRWVYAIRARWTWHGKKRGWLWRS